MGMVILEKRNACAFSSSYLTKKIKRKLKKKAQKSEESTTRKKNRKFKGMKDSKDKPNKEASPNTGKKTPEKRCQE
ncbi:hypothetical protein WDU94_010498 [Cyamophila willieti]